MDDQILINKLEYFGIIGTPLQWPKSYLTDRTLCVALKKIGCNGFVTQNTSKLVKTERRGSRDSFLGCNLIFINCIVLMIFRAEQLK